MNRRVFLERAALAALVAGCSDNGSASSPRSQPAPPPISSGPATAPPPTVTLEDLRSAMRGALLLPGDAGYADARTVYNRRYSGIRPQAVAVPESEHDVRACVRFAARSGMRIAARSGGHSYAGYSTTPGLQVDLRNVSSLHIAPDRRSVTAGAGCLLTDVVTALGEQGLAIPTGSCPTVGLGGSALGGGVGLASRAFGTTADNVLSVRIVTADGKLREVNRRSDPDLYWACRGGGGGNFGIATAFRLRTHPVGDSAYVFCDWPWSQAPAVVAAWQALAPHAPDRAYLLCSLSTDAGGPRVRVFGQLIDGTEAELRALVAPLAAVDGASISSGAGSYLHLQQIWAGCSGKTADECRAFLPSRFAARSDYAARELPEEAVRAAMRSIERRGSQRGGTGALLLDPYGGALNRVAPDATAFVHRDQLFSFQYLAYSTDRADVPTADVWLDSFHGAMRPYVSGQAYQNYIDPTLAGWEDAYYGSNLDRLREVKHTYDPENLFRFHQSIRA